MGKREIVVTGLGILSPIGIELDSFWNALIEGKSGVGYLDSVNTQLERRPIGSEVPDFHPKDYIKPRKNIKVMSRDIQMGIVAALLACQNAGINLEEGSRSVDPDRIGCVFGCDLIGTELGLLKDAFKDCVADGRFDFSKWGPASIDKIMPLWMLRYLPNMVASHVAITLDARGPNNTLNLDRGSSLAAIMEACRIIERGAADVMIVGGVGNKVNPTILARSGAYSLAPRTENPQEHPRPFDARRAGTVVGEGSGVFVLESREFAEARGAKPLALVKGFAERLHPTGKFGSRQEAVESVVKETLRVADLKPADLDHVNANAFGLDDDKLEAQGIARTLGDVPVFSVAGHIGNLGSGAGAVELAASLLALSNGVVPATRNCENVAEDCPINVVKDAPRKVVKPTFMKLSHANTGRSFGLILEKY